MVEANVTFGKNSTRIYVKGHTEPKICSAISAITYSMLGALENFKTDGYELDYEDKDGETKCNIMFVEEWNSNRLDTVIDMWLIGLQQIQLKYPDSISVTQSFL